MKTFEGNIIEIEQGLGKAGYQPLYDLNSDIKGTLLEISGHKEAKRDLSKYGISKIYATPKEPIRGLYANKDYSLDYLLTIDYTQSGFRISSIEAQLIYKNQHREAHYVEVKPERLIPLKSLLESFGKCVPNTKISYQQENIQSLPMPAQENYDLAGCKVTQVISWLNELNNKIIGKGYNALYPYNRNGDSSSEIMTELEKMMVVMPASLDAPERKIIQLNLPGTQEDVDMYHAFQIKHDAKNGFNISEVKVLSNQESAAYKFMSIHPRSFQEMPTKSQFTKIYREINQQAKKVKRGKSL